MEVFCQWGIVLFWLYSFAVNMDTQKTGHDKILHIWATCLIMGYGAGTFSLILK